MAEQSNSLDTVSGGDDSPKSEILDELRFKKRRSTGSTLPEHSRFSPGKHKARNYLKDVLIVFQVICSVRIA